MDVHGNPDILGEGLEAAADLILQLALAAGAEARPADEHKGAEHAGEHKAAERGGDDDLHEGKAGGAGRARLSARC
jgi:hypothetical protein